jgi:(2R)-sulfolactate sulfo-lyase subunit alpha
MWHNFCDRLFIQGGVSMIKVLVHDKKDTVGVANCDIKAGEVVKVKIIDSGEEFDLKALMDIPLGHKIALKDHKIGEGVIKYGQDIGKVVADIKKGEHVHIHNLKTRRW